MSQDPASPAPPPMPAAPPPPPPLGGSGGPGGPAGTPQRFPWEERDRLGFLNALIETIKLLVTAPRDAFSRLRADGDYVWPLIFGLILTWVGHLFGQVWNLLFGSAIQSMFMDIDELAEMAQYFGTSMIQAAVSLTLWPVIYLVVIFLFAGLSHLILMVLSAVDDSPLGFEGTLKVVAYASAFDLLNVVPIAGWFLAFVGKLVLYVFGFAEVHKTSEGKAIAAVGLILFTCCCCLPVILAGFFGLVGASMAALMSIVGNG